MRASVLRADSISGLNIRMATIAGSKRRARMENCGVRLECREEISRKSYRESWAVALHFLQSGSCIGACAAGGGPLRSRLSCWRVTSSPRSEEHTSELQSQSKL